jgi:phosphoribosylglycinamide formyltransferase-1
MKKLGVMVSGGGTDLQSVIDAVADGQIRAQIALVISDKKDAYALERAQTAGIDTAVVERKNYSSKKEFTEANLALFRKYQIDGIVLAGYLSILGKEVIDAYPEKILNIHPALIPAFCGKGYYRLKVHEAVLEDGAKVTGVTIHFVDEKADAGPIIAQEAVVVEDADTAETLQQRVLAVEHILLPKIVALFCEDRIRVNGRKVTII